MRATLVFLCLLVGLTCVVYGAFQAWTPLGWVTVGLVLIVAALFVDPERVRRASD